MGSIIIIIILVILLINQLFLSWVLIHIEEWLASLCDTELDFIEEKPKATDPFQKPKPIYSSTDHIIVPKSPQEIKNQNFKKIKEGLEYGDIAKR